MGQVGNWASARVVIFNSTFPRLATSTLSELGTFKKQVPVDLDVEQQVTLWLGLLSSHHPQIFLLSKICGSPDSHAFQIVPLVVLF